MGKIKQTGKNQFEFNSPDLYRVVLKGYEKIYPFSNDIAIFKIKDPNNSSKFKHGYINLYGERINNHLYDYCENFDYELAKVKLEGKQNYVRSDGSEILSWNYSYVEKYIGQTFIINFYSDEGLNLWGLVSIDENFIIPPDCSSKIEVMLEAKNHLKEIAEKWT